MVRRALLRVAGVGLLGAGVQVFASRGPCGSRARFQRHFSALAARQADDDVLTEDDLAGLPELVARHVRRSGARRPTQGSELPRPGARPHSRRGRQAVDGVHRRTDQHLRRRAGQGAVHEGTDVRPARRRAAHLHRRVRDHAREAALGAAHRERFRPGNGQGRDGHRVQRPLRTGAGRTGGCPDHVGHRRCASCEGHLHAWGPDRVGRTRLRRRRTN